MTSSAIVVGGGFYGAIIAAHLKRRRGIARVTLLEREAELMQRASFVNQARVHTGYHYPRSFTTAYRSVINAPRFRADFGASVVSNFTAVYCVARRNSRVTVRQMERFCQEIGAPLAPARPEIAALFNPVLIERAYEVSEQAFDSAALCRLVTPLLDGVQVMLGAEVEGVSQAPDRITVRGRRGAEGFELSADMAFNCTYSRLQYLAGPLGLGLKHEIAELALIEPPSDLASLGVTVMDGPFFSSMPFPALGRHSLTHVRYTPHAYWFEDGAEDPYRVHSAYHRESRADRMLRDASRYMPRLMESRVDRSLFEVKTVLVQNEGDDGRPILFVRHRPHGRLFSVLGGKIDNIYDVLERLDNEALPLASGTEGT